MRLVVAVLACSGCQFVFPRDSVPPPEVDAPPDPLEAANIVFVTANVHDANFGGVAGADEICRQAAITGGFEGEFVAWLSDSTTSALSRLNGSRGWVRPDGQPVADQPGDLTFKGPLVPISVSESKDNLLNGTDVFVLTGTGPDGSIQARCNDWTSTSATDQVLTGNLIQGGGGFTAIGTITCSLPTHIYCFGIGKQFALQPSRSPDDFVMFVSAGTFAVGPTGRDEADRVCKLEAMDAQLEGTFLAVLPVEGEKALARFPVDHDYVRPDGVRIGHFLTDATPTIYPNVTAGLSRLNNVTDVAWTGGLFTAAPDVSMSCASWMSSAGAGVGGNPVYASSRTFSDVPFGCANPGHVYCAQL